MALVFHQFLQLIDNDAVVWSFQIIGNATVIGNVIGHMIEPHGTPVTIKVRQKDRVVVEIPWTSIQFIREIENRELLIGE